MLTEQLREVLTYGNAAVVTMDKHSYESTDSLARNRYSWMFGRESGVMFVIDMYLRNIYIYCDGEIHRVINTRRANEITDNTYRLASQGKYYECVSESYKQIITLLEGGRIFTPMKYVAYFFISLGLALMICIIVVMAQRRLPKLLKDKNGNGSEAKRKISA